MITTAGTKATHLAVSGKRLAVGGVEAQPQAAAGFQNILACIDTSPQAGIVLSWANTLARRLHGSLRTLCVLDTSTGSAAPYDPIAWEMRRIEARNRVGHLLENAGADESDTVGIEVAIGPFDDRFHAVLDRSDVDICLIGAVGEDARPGRVIGDTARRIIEAAPCSVLIVPPGAMLDSGQAAALIRRVMVPLDCSRRAEVALPMAVALADAFGAELVVAHALPEPAITEIGPLDEAAVALRRNIAQHNRKAAERYMSRLRARLALDRRAVRTLVVNGDDPRHRLARAAVEEAPDLIVLAAKGAGGYADQSLGSVADFLVNHMCKPLLVVRSAPGHTVRARAARLGAAGMDKPDHGRN